MLFQIHESLNATGKKRLKGMLFDGFKDDKGILPLKLEVEMVTHLVKQGFNINFHDLENNGGYDFEITKGSVKAEVECKCFGDDAGCKIHHKEMVELCNLFKIDLKQACKIKAGGYFINITVRSRLPTGHLEIGKIANSVKEQIYSDAVGIFEFESYKIEKKRFEIEKSPFIEDIQPNDMGMKFVHEYCANEFNKDNEQTFAYWKSKKVAFIIIIDSEKESELVDRIYRDAKKSCDKQFSKKLPGILVVKLTGISSIDLARIADSDKDKVGNPSGLQLIATRLMKSDKRSHLHTVAFLPGRTTLESVVDKNTTTWGSSGPVYTFRNENHSEYNNIELNVFG